MQKLLSILFTIPILWILGCGPNSNNNESTSATYYSFPIANLTTEQYPDNPDIGFWAQKYTDIYFEKGQIKQLDAFNHRISFYAKSGDSIVFDQLDLSELIPTIPTAIQEQEYLAFLACVNQEWNRNQIRFTTNSFSCSDSLVSRVDIARNCLQSYLWEIILYTKEADGEKAYAHGWFTFPKSHYHVLFEAKNGVSFQKYQEHLVDWKDPNSENIKLDQLRNIIRISCERSK